MFSDENRLRIVLLLHKKDLCVCELEVILELSQSNLSKHLSHLKKNDIVESKKSSLWTMYCLSEEFINNHSMLYEYILFESDKSLVFVDDLRRLKTYLEKNICCNIASENKQQVLDLLKENHNDRRKTKIDN
ncbi:ArsR/SmtB family transcription factor [Culicoidibacter larvae]|uniref:ArsR/SmtB family transcription factor n=1 Tax=Culicoidibacter larvae TaxID=2579976 RepID=UPI001484E90A